MDAFVYVCDALRPDFLGCYGADHDTSPNIDAVADDAIVFTNAYAPATWTKPAGASILTGQYPRAVNIKHTFDKLNRDVELLPQFLQRMDFNTFGVTSQGFISGRFGFERGFDEYINLRTAGDEADNVTPEGISSDKDLKLEDSTKINDKILPLISKTSGDIFSLLWSVDTHYPYLIPYEFQKFSDMCAKVTFEKGLQAFASEHGLNHLKQLYRDMIQFNDRSIGDLVAFLKDQGRWNDSLFFIVGDHGEAFGEHGEVGHAGLVHEEQTRVPMILKLSGNKYGGQKIDTPVSLIDLFPTIVSEIGTDDSLSVDGVALQTVVEGDSRQRPILSETFPDPGTAFSRSVRFGRYKRMSVEYPNLTDGDGLRNFAANLLNLRKKFQWRTDRLYDFEQIKGQATPVGIDVEPEEMKTKRTNLVESVTERKEAGTAQEWDTDNQSEEFRERLRKLGYIE